MTRRTRALLATAPLCTALLAGCATSSSTDSQGSAPAPSASSTSTAPLPTAAATVDVAVAVADGKITPPVGPVAVPVGSPVHLTVTSDTDDAVHVHGYDLQQDVPAGGTVTFDFTADQAGTFEVEAHENDLLLTQLVVS